MRLTALPENFQKEVLSSGIVNPTDKAIRFMQNNLSRSITLENIAQAVQLSTSFWSRKFKQDTSYAPIEYFNYLRIQKVCQLLHFSDLHINEVAAQLGIDDTFYFSRLFKKQMGVSPAEYRKSEGIQRKIT
jgi:AraC family transcriptional regulator of arabinose operon